MEQATAYFLHAGNEKEVGEMADRLGVRVSDMTIIGGDTTEARVRFIKFTVELEKIPKGTRLHVTGLDAIGNDVFDAYRAVLAADEKGVFIVAHADELDTSTPKGREFIGFATKTLDLRKRFTREAQGRSKGTKGRRHFLRDSEPRQAYLRELEKRGRLLDVNGAIAVSYDELREGLNAADPTAETIKSNRTLQRWESSGRPWLHDQAD